MTIEQILDNITSRELSEWMAFSQVEPIGDARADLRTAILAAVIANGSRDTNKKPDPFAPSDFLIDFWRRTDPAQIVDTSSRNKFVAEIFVAAGLGTISEG